MYIFTFITSCLNALLVLVYRCRNHRSGLWGCRIHRLHLCRGLRPPPRVSWYDTKQSDSEAPLILELWGMQSTPLLPSNSGSFCSAVVAPDRVLSMDQIELNCVLMLNWIVWNRNVLTFKLSIYAKQNCSK